MTIDTLPDLRPALPPPQRSGEYLLMPAHDGPSRLMQRTHAPGAAPDQLNPHGMSLAAIHEADAAPQPVVLPSVARLGQVAAATPSKRKRPEQRSIPDFVTAGLTESRYRLAAIGQYIDADEDSTLRFNQARGLERAKAREAMMRRLPPAGVVAVNGLTQAAGWLRSRHASAKRALRSAVRSTLASA